MLTKPSITSHDLLVGEKSSPIPNWVVETEFPDVGLTLRSLAS